VKAAAWILLLGATLFGGCRAAHNVAVTSFRVIDAPANYVRNRIDRRSETQTTTTNTTVSSDAVTTPGRTVTVAPTDRDTERRKVTTQNQPRTNATPTPGPRVTTEKSKPSPSPSPRSATTQTAQYPTAKPVPGKPGYVFSPFDPSGGYVDVNGYTSGQKVKDPYSGKIFLVP
jgi:cell division septation protein DedD